MVLFFSNLTQSAGLNRPSKSKSDVQGCVNFYEHHDGQGQHFGCFPAGTVYSNYDGRGRLSSINIPSGYRVRLHKVKNHMPDEQSSWRNGPMLWNFEERWNDCNCKVEVRSY